jgi:hypothetical protein
MEDSIKTYSHIHLPDLTRELVATGFLPVDAQGAAITHRALPGLLISQVGGLVESSVFDLNCGYGTGCILPLHIGVDLPVFSIWGWELDLPWKDPTFQFLPEPQGHVFPTDMYQIPGCENLKYSRYEVINHRRVLRRGQSLDGLLLGFSFESIPDSYQHGANIEARLVLIDGMERCFSTRIQLWVNRIAKIDWQRKKKNSRRPLFENPECKMNGLVQT